MSAAPQDGETLMHGFLEALRVQRWDDHRYYHHSRINQSLHLISAISFVFAYVMMFKDPAIAALVGWLISMTTRQAGHFFFEPKTYDHYNQATHEHKEDIKVGYNLRRKVVLMTIWAASPIALYFDPTWFGIFEPHTTPMEGSASSSRTPRPWSSSAMWRSSGSPSVLAD
jgi:hypothetical protein